MARRVFFSFHYQRDIWRVNQIRNLDQVVGTAAAGFADASLWEESKKKGDSVIKKMIDDALYNTSVTVVCIGNQTAGRRFIEYEIEQSRLRGNGIIGVQIHHLKNSQGVVDTAGVTPVKLTTVGAKIYKYTDHASLKSWIDAAAKAAGR